MYVCIYFCLFMAGPGHMEGPRLGVKSESQLPSAATATPDQRCVYNLHHSSRQRQILNLLSEARDQTHILMDTNWVCYR